MKRVLQGAVIFMAALGGLTLIWAITTYFWKEPYTAWQHHAQEKKLEQQLQAEASATPYFPARPARRNGNPPVSVNVTQPTYMLAGPATPEPALPILPQGHAVGRLTGPHVNAILTYGRNNINAGPGMWHARPGYQKTVVVSGHRTTYGAPFRHINEIKIGSILTLKSPFGVWHYQVTRKAIVRPNDIWVARNRGFEQLVLTACHPPYSAAYRYVVFARFFNPKA